MKILLDKKLNIHDKPGCLGEDIDKQWYEYVELIQKEFESMYTNDIINLLGIPNSSNIDTNSPMFILPNGSIISVAQAGKLIGQDYSDNVHSDIVHIILTAIAKKYDYDWDTEDKRYEDRKLQWLTYELGWARVNCGTTWLESRFYCVLPNHMTSSQYRSLEKWLEWGYDNKEDEVLVFASSYEDSQTYDFEDNLPEDIIKKVKRYYSSGRLYEDRNELTETMDITNQVHYAVDNIMNNKDRYHSQDDLESAIYSAVANVFSGMHGVTRDTADMIADVYEQELKRVGLDSLDEEFVSELVPGELYHFIHNNKILYGTFKRKTPAWLFFDVEGKEVLVEPWTSVATTTEELEELIGLVDKMEKDTKILSQVPNRFTRVPNQHNKPMGESNELEQRAKKHRKKSKGMGWHMAFNAGDVEKGIEVFNNSTSLGTSTSGGDGTAMGESIDQNTYHYDGPIYYRGHKIAEKSDIFTTAKSINIAIRNTLVKAARGDKELYNYDIVDHMVELVPPDEVKPKRPRCQTCGYELNDIGDCPVCDYGEDDLLESLTDLEALWELSNLD